MIVCVCSCAWLPLCTQWVSKAFLPTGADCLSGSPCIHDEFVYCGFKETGRAQYLALYRIKVSELLAGDGAWQSVRLPLGLWHPDVYCFSASGFIHCLLCPPNCSDVYRIFRRDRDGEWHHVTPLPKKRYNFAVTVVLATVLVVGGSSGPDRSSEPLSSVLAVDLAAAHPKCDYLPSLPFASVEPQAVQVNFFLHVFSCHGDSVAATASQPVVSMDVSNGAGQGHWSSNVLPSAPHAKCGTGVLNDCLIVLGGETESGVRSTYSFVQECRTYLALPSLNAPLELCHCLSHGNTLLVFPRRHSQKAMCEVLSI